MLIWFENFSSDCSFCSETEHVIEVYPLPNSPKKELTIQVLKNPKWNSLYDALVMAIGQACHATTAEPTNVVHVRPKYLTN